MSRLYRALLLAYPASFRARYGRAMLRAFEEEVAELRERRGLWVWTRALGRAVRDTLATAVQMRWARWRGRPGAPLRRRETLSWRVGRLVRRGTPGSGEAPRAPGPSGRASRGAPLDTLFIDLTFAARALRRNPGFATVAIVTLAIGIGANTAIFSVIDGVLLRPLPVHEPERLVVVMENQAVRGGGFQPWAVSPADFRDWQERNDVFSGMTLISDTFATLGEGEEAEEIQGLRVSANFFDVLGVPAALGRMFRTGEDAAGAPPVIVISDGLWRRTFGGDPAIVGKEVRLSGLSHTVIGVAPEEFSFARVLGGDVDSAPRDYWTLDPLETPWVSLSWDERRIRILSVIARLSPGVTLEQAREEMNAIARGIAEEVPGKKNRAGVVNGVYVENLHRRLVGGLRPALWILMGTVGIVLLIACTNVANLLLARSESRRREIAVRAAIGAGRSRLARQLMTESLLLTSISGAAGMLLAWWVVPNILARVPVAIPSSLLDNVGIDGRVLAFTTMVGALTALTFGLAPALISSGDGPGPALRGARAAGTRGRGLAGRQLLVATEVALALALLIGLGLMTATLDRLHAVPLGFEASNVYWTEIELPAREAEAPESDARGNLVRRLTERLAALPEVEAAGVASLLPLQTRTIAGGVHVEGRPTQSGEPAGAVTVDETGGADGAYFRYITPGYFETVRQPVVRGRDFEWRDDAAAPDVAIINEAMAEAYWPGQNPIGRRVARVTRGGELRLSEIVGIVGNTWELNHYWINDDRGAEALPPILYQPAVQWDAPAVNGVVQVVVRTNDDEEVARAAIAVVLDSADPDLAIVAARPLQVYVDDQLISDELSFSALIIGIMSAIALLLALIGVYGTMAFHVASRTQEIGVRMALGARFGTIIGMIVGQGLQIALLGALAGVLVATGTTHLLSRWLYGVSPTDPLTFASLSIVMVSVAVLACWIPARRAAHVDPVTSLRAE